MKKLQKKMLFIFLCLFGVYLVNAQEKDVTYYIESAIGGKYLDVINSNPNRGAGLQLWPFNESNAQKFTLRDAEDGFFYIESNTRDKRALHVYHANRDPGAIVILWEIVNYDNLKWRFVDAGDGYHYIQSRLENYLDVQWGSSEDGTPIWMWSFNRGDAQRWKLVPVFNTPDNTKVFSPKNFGTRCITVAENHLQGGNRNIGTEADCTLSVKFDLVNNSIRATVNVRMTRSQRIRATWSEILIKGGDKKIESFDVGYAALQNRNPNFQKEHIRNNIFVLPKGGADFFDCHTGHIESVTLDYGVATVVGDTGGTDITTDYDCSCDARLVDIDFREIIVKYEEEEQCSRGRPDSTIPTYEFTIYDDADFEFTFTDKDDIEPTYFEVLLKPNTDYNFKLEVNDNGQSLSSINFSSFFNSSQIVSIDTNGWQSIPNGSSVSYRWTGLQGRPRCRAELSGVLRFNEEAQIDRNEVFTIIATDDRNNSINRNISVVVANNLPKARVKYNFNYGF